MSTLNDDASVMHLTGIDRFLRRVDVFGTGKDAGAET